MASLSSWLRDEQEALLVPGATPLDDIFEEEPVPLEVFVGDKKFLGNPPLSEKQYDAVRHIERVYYSDLYPQMAVEFDSAYWAEHIRMVHLVTLQWGKGSGKDHICRIASMRIAYLLLCLKSPQVYFEMPEQDTITMLNIASSSTQAEAAFFRPMVRAVKRGWFADKCEPKQQMIAYDKNLEAVSGHSDAEGQEGGNLILGVADEIDAFKSKEELERYRGRALRESPRSADAILKMLRTSASTRFPETYKNVRISYPRYLGSTIQKLTERAHENVRREGSRSRHYVSGPWATWEVNPRVKGPEAFADDYLEDPAMAQAMYECRPSRAVDTYFKNPDVLRTAFTDAPQPIAIDYQTTRMRSEVTGTSSLVWAPVYSFLADFRPVSGARYALHADLAVKGDKAGIAMSHVVRYDEITETGYDDEGSPVETSYTKPVVKTDFVIAYEADVTATPVREIQIRWVRLLAFDLIRRGFSVVSLTFDGFQSTDSMQILTSHGIESTRLSMDISEDPWRTLRDVLYEQRLEIPYSAALLTELESLGRFSGKVDHPPAGSKDLADALCGSVTGAILAGGEEVRSADGSVEVAFPGGDTVSVGYWDLDLAGSSDPDVPGMGLPLGFPAGLMPL